MKNQLLLGVIALSLLALAACNQNAVDPSSASSARVSSTSSGTATGSNSETIITQAQLPAAVGTYLTATYPGYTFVQAEQGTDAKGNTYYEVQFTYNGTTSELHFDSTGTIQSGKGGHADGPHSGTATGSNLETIITQAQLPAAVSTYLTATYPGYTFVQAEQGIDAKGATYYEVQFTYNGNTKELHFDTSGTVVTH